MDRKGGGRPGATPPPRVGIGVFGHRKPIEAGLFYQPRDVADACALTPAVPVLDGTHREHQVVVHHRTSDRAMISRCTSVAPSPSRLTRRSRNHLSSGNSVEIPSAP